MVNHLLNYTYHRALRFMLFQTHMNIKHFLRFEFYQPGNGSVEIEWIHAFWLQTGTAYSSGRWVMHPVSIVMVSRAWNPNFPWMMLLGTVTMQSFFHSKLHKQLEMMMIGVECKRNFEVWLRFEEDWWILVFGVFLRFWWIWEVLDPILGNVIFCYD